MPFTSKDYYREAIQYMLDYSKEHNFDFTIECATEEFNVVCCTLTAKSQNS